MSLGAPPRRWQEGFTLVELMIVMTLIAIAGAAVMLAIPDGRGQLRADAERFAARVRAAQDQAILGGRPIALIADAGGYRFEERLGGGWQPVTVRPFQRQRWADGTQAIVPAGGGRALIDPTGGSEPLALALVRNQVRVTVNLDGDGSIDVRG